MEKRQHVNTREAVKANWIAQSFVFRYSENGMGLISVKSANRIIRSLTFSHCSFVVFCFAFSCSFFLFCSLLLSHSVSRTIQSGFFIVAQTKIRIEREKRIQTNNGFPLVGCRSQELVQNCMILMMRTSAHFVQAKWKTRKRKKKKQQFARKRHLE